MSQGANLFGILSTNSACTAFVGSGVNAQIFDDTIQQGREAPAYVLNLIVGRPENVMEAPAVADYELYQLDAWALDSDTAKAMISAARTALSDIDEMIARDVGIKVVAAYPSTFEQETRRYKRSIGVAIWSQP